MVRVSVNVQVGMPVAKLTGRTSVGDPYSRPTHFLHSQLKKKKFVIFAWSYDASVSTEIT